MPLQHLQHFLIQCDDIDATRDWYVDILGMESGPHPDFGFPVHWLYIDGKDVLHLCHGGDKTSNNRLQYLGQQSTDTNGSGVIDHVAFRSTGLLETIERLREKNTAFTERQADHESLYQLCLNDPNGVKIELNFDASEAVDRTADVTRESLADTA